MYAYTTGELGAVVNTINYGYGDNVWKDLLTSYNGNAITYDNIGNMTSFNGKTYSWLGRQLQSINGLATYTYNMDGLRTSKTANGVTTNYYYNGSTLAGQISSDGTKLIFLYDENGDIFGLTYGNDNYYYIKNAQNDVIAIANSSGNVITSYTYDSWGKVLSITGDVAWFGQLNPIRYRSYYYDNESGMYYLQSRYYNPEIGRFINADGLVSTGQGLLSHNMFAYCNNNPVNMVDSNGNLPKWAEKAVKWAKKNIVDPIVNAVERALTIQHNVPLYEQGNTNLCWAYSQTMIEDSINNTNRTQTQADERARELGIQQNGEENWSDAGFPTNTNERVDVSNIYDMVEPLLDGPVYAHYVDGGEIGHMVVVTGVNLFEQTVFVNNPWGFRGEIAFDEFLVGFPGSDENSGYTLLCLWDVDA